MKHQKILAISALFAVSSVLTFQSCALRPLSEGEMAQLKSFVANLNETQTTMNTVAKEAEVPLSTAEMVAASAAPTTAEGLAAMAKTHKAPEPTAAEKAAMARENKHQRAARVFKSRKFLCKITPPGVSTAGLTFIEGLGCPVNVVGSMNVSSNGKASARKILYEIRADEIRDTLDITRGNVEMMSRTSTNSDKTDINANTVWNSKQSGVVGVDAETQTSFDPKSLKAANSKTRVTFKMRDFTAELIRTRTGGVETTTLNGKNLSLADAAALVVVSEFTPSLLVASPTAPERKFDVSSTESGAQKLQQGPPPPPAVMALSQAQLAQARAESLAVCKKEAKDFVASLSELTQESWRKRLSDGLCPEDGQHLRFRVAVYKSAYEFARDTRQMGVYDRHMFASKIMETKAPLGYWMEYKKAYTGAPAGSSDSARDSLARDKAEDWVR